MKKKQKLIHTCLLAAAVAAATLGQSRLDAQAPTIIIQPTNRAVWVGGTVTFGVTISGGGPFSYQWRLNGTNLPNDIITTVAGGGVGDNGPATNASLAFPDGVAVDASGSLFIADRNNRRIRKVSTNNIITTVAGGGTNSLTDGVVGIDAEINFPYSVAVDGSGNLYFGQALFNLGISLPSIAKLSSTGILTTEAGYGPVFSYYVNPSTLAVDSSGNVFFASFEQVRTIDTNGDLFVVAGGGPEAPAVDGEAATNAYLDRPYSLAVDRLGNLFVASADRIYKINSSGILTTVAGNDTGGYSGDGGAATNAALSTPEGLAVDSFANVFFADTGNNRIRKVDTNGVITTVAGNGTTNYSGDGGPATNASLNFPSSVAVDSAGNLFIADSQNNCIRKVTSGGIITTVAGSGIQNFAGDGGLATDAILWEPSGIAVAASGELLIADMYNSRVRKVGLDGVITTVAGNGTTNYAGNGATATKTGISYPSSVAVDASGNLFISNDDNNNRVFTVNTNGIVTTVAGNGISGFSGDRGPATNAELWAALGVAVDTNDNLLIADFGNSRVRKVDTNGIITTVAGIGQSAYFGDGGPAIKAGLEGPRAVASDNVGNFFVAEQGARIRKVNTKGVISTVAGNGAYTNSGDGGLATNAAFGMPSGIAADVFGNLFIAELNNCVIRKVDADGIITTFAGNGTEEFSGDGGPATNAALSSTGGVAVDAFGNVFIADSDNARIRKVINTQGSVLRLDNVSTGDSGDYDVILTGPGGKTISRVASLLVAASPLAYESELQPPGGVTMYFLARPNSANVLLSTASLAPPVTWQPISTNLAGTDGAWQYTDTNTAGSAARFFRSVTINSQ